MKKSCGYLLYLNSITLTFLYTISRLQHLFPMLLLTFVIFFLSTLGILIITKEQTYRLLYHCLVIILVFFTQYNYNTISLQNVFSIFFIDSICLLVSIVTSNLLLSRINAQIFLPFLFCLDGLLMVSLSYISITSWIFYLLIIVGVFTYGTGSYMGSTTKHTNTTFLFIVISYYLSRFMLNNGFCSISFLLPELILIVLSIILIKSFYIKCLLPLLMYICFVILSNLDSTMSLPTLLCIHFAIAFIIYSISYKYCRNIKEIL